MPDLTTVLKDEIRRLARKEIKSSVGELKKQVTEQRKQISALRQRVANLEVEKKRLVKRVASVQDAGQEAEAAAEESPALRARFSGKSIQKLRDKLRLTQAELAQLAGVSPQAVYQWERKGGPLRLRNATKEALVQVRALGLRDVRRQLEKS